MNALWLGVTIVCVSHEFIGCCEECRSEALLVSAHLCQAKLRSVTSLLNIQIVI